MDKLVALPTCGDAFLLCRSDRNILVDGGYSSRKLIAALSRPDVAISHLHILVCTHNDKDHAGGLTDLLDKKSVRVDEFWLPGAWSDSLPELLRSPNLVVNALVAELDRFLPEKILDSDFPEDDQFESQVYAHIAEERSRILRQLKVHEKSTDLGRQLDGSGLAWLKQQAVDIDLNETNAMESAKAFNRGRRLIRYRSSKRQLSRQWTAFWLELINTAERIRKIAVQAIRHQVNVRWFDFSEFARTRHACGGDYGLLVPLNAVELAVPPSPMHELSYMARLTPVNEECLVFFSPGRLFKKLGVVFSGDSPMGDGPGYTQNFLPISLEPRQLVIATAPHHGSQSNAMAYWHLDTFAEVVLWLRSGGTQKHPGLAFRKLLPALRACTNCPHLNFVREVVEVQLSCVTSSSLQLFKVRARDCRC